MAGLTATGLTIENIESLLAQMVADQLANISPTLNTEADAVLGQLNAIYAAAILSLWELFEDVWQSSYPDTASGQSLSYLASLTGTIRAPATKGTVTLRFHGADTTPVPAGTEVYVVGRPDSRFVTLADQTIGAPTFLDIACEAVTAGSSTYILAGESFALPNPPAGVTTPSTAAADSVLGADEESDADLRLRRELELARPGSGTVEAIRADLLAVTGVDAAQVYENNTPVVDVNGLPPHSIECLVYSETAPTYTAADVAEAIWLAKPAGTETYGSLSEEVTDSAGDPHTINYSEPASITVYIEVALEQGEGYIGDTAVKDAIALWALQNLSVGDDVITSDLVSVVSELEGVVAVDGANTGADDTPGVTGNQSLSISLRQVPSVLTTNITVDSGWTRT